MTATFPLVNAIASGWWVLALRGLLAVLFGLAAFFWPLATVGALVLVFGAFAMVYGILAVVAGIRARWWGMLIAGLGGIALGVLTILWPGITALALLYLIAAWALIVGILQVVAAVQLRREISNEWLLALAGVVTIVWAVLLVLFPAAGALSVLWIIGAFALVIGILELVLAFRLRSLPRRLAAATL
jgi:uncharacterized membrane protein HdeD (DUF308 family)